MWVDYEAATSNATLTSIRPSNFPAQPTTDEFISDEDNYIL